MNNRLVESLRKLRMSGLLQSLEVRLHEASSNKLSHAEFLELILADELDVRFDRLVERRTRAAGFRDQKTLEDFNWDFNRKIKRKQFLDLAAGQFIRQARNVFLPSPSRRRR